MTPKQLRRYVRRLKKRGIRGHRATLGLAYISDCLKALFIPPLLAYLNAKSSIYDAFLTAQEKDPSD